MNPVRKNFFITFLSMLCLSLITGCGKQENWSADTAKQLYQADPTIFSEKNLYYLYGTNELDTSQGFQVFASKDLVHWVSPDGNSNRLALKKGDAFGNGGFWAPQVFAYKNSYYMAYVADEQMAIAKSSSPIGPFTQPQLKPLIENSQYKTIDPFVFFDDDGQKYLYYVQVNGGNNIYGAKMNDDLSGIEEGTQQECITTTEPWENTANASYPVTEGPTVLKKQGTYYLFYSANDFRNPNYAVGYATSSHPLGPWKKHDDPMISKRNILRNGTGHGDVFVGPANQFYYVFHTHFASDEATPRKTAIVKLSFTPQKDEPSLFSADPKSFHYIQEYVKQSK